MNISYPNVQLGLQVSAEMLVVVRIPWESTDPASRIHYITKHLIAAVWITTANN